MTPNDELNLQGLAEEILEDQRVAEHLGLSSDPQEVNPDSAPADPACRARGMGYLEVASRVRYPGRD